MHKLRRFGFNAIKESFDRLPTAVCFFDRSGGIVLCNRQMYRLSQYLLNSDMQYLEELQKALASPPKGITPIASAENTYRFPDGLVWKFEKAAVTDRYGETYIQLTAADVTALHRALEQLAEESAELAQAALKVARILRGDNPTPVTLKEAEEHLVEEYTDVYQCVMELDVPVDWQQIEEKRERFMKRVREMRSANV